MALKTEPLSSIQPFWHIDCPVCGGDDFTEMGTGGGVWCDQCNAEFRVRGTSGDAGCVVDCLMDEVCNILKRDGKKYAWLKSLVELGCYTEPHFRDGRKPKIYAYRIMKEPGMSGTYCTDDRGWLLSLHGQVLTADVPKIISDKQKGVGTYIHLEAPIVSKEMATEWGALID